MKCIEHILFSYSIFPLFVITSNVTATIIKVPQDQPTIQAGIDSGIDLLNNAKRELQKGDYFQAIEILERIVAEDSLYVQAFFILGSAYQSMSEYNKALLLLKRANLLDPDDVNIMLALGRCYMELGHLSQAQKQFETVLGADSSNPSARLKLGDVYMKQQRYGRASETFRPLLQHSPTKSYVSMKLGVCAYHAGDLDLSKVHLRNAHQINPGSPVIVLHLSRVYRDLEEFDSALKVVTECLRKHPKHLALLRQRGDLLVSTGDYWRARSTYYKLISLGDSSAVVFQRLGFCHYYTGEISSARNAFGQAFQKDSTSALNCFYHGITNKELGSHERAQRLYGKALSLALPSFYPDIFVESAKLYESEEEYDNAVKAYEKALEYDADRCELVFYVAAIYDKHYADRKMALSHYEKYLKHVREYGCDFDEKVAEYAAARIEKLREEIFLEEK
ncbi:MAG: tetratricopeptide repeat protein [Candidatus Neomarinimicrobiota bacterium]